MANLQYHGEPPPVYTPTVDIATHSNDPLRCTTPGVHNTSRYGIDSSGSPKPPPYDHNAPYQVRRYQEVSLASLPTSSLPQLYPLNDVRMTPTSTSFQMEPPTILQPEHFEGEFSTFWYIMLASFVLVGCGVFFGLFALIVAGTLSKVFAYCIYCIYINSLSLI